MTVFTLQVNGSRGELTPLMHGRVDTDFYQAGWHTARNVVLTGYGACARVPGSIYKGQPKEPHNFTALLPFEFNEEQVYALEFGDEYVRFWTRDGIVMKDSAPYEVASPYGAAVLGSLHAVQSGDAVYLFGGGQRPHILRRKGETDWDFVPYKPKDGPYLPINDTQEYAFLFAPGLITPKMSANTTGGVTVSTSSGNASAWHIFNRVKGAAVQVSTTGTGWVRVDLGAGNAKVVDNYWISAGALNAETDSMFTSWELQGSDNATSWVVLDSRDGETGWASSEIRYFEAVNNRKFRYYQIAFTGGSGYDPDHDTTEMGQLALGWAAVDQTPIELGFSNISVVNDGAGFKAADVGRPIRLQGPEGRWRWAEIVSIESPTMVKVRLHGQPFNDEATVSTFRFGAWSDHTGWPHTARLFEDRLAAAGTDKEPLGVWMSVTGAYDNYRVSQPLVDDDALSLRLTGGTFSRVQWLAETGSLLVGTGAVLRSIGGRDGASVLSPTNVRQRAETTTAASNVRPIEVETVVLLIDRYRKRLFEAAYAYESDGYLTRELSILAEHLFGVGIRKLEWLDTPHKVAVCLRDDGKMVFFSYDREQKIAGATLVDYGEPVDEVLALPGPEGTDLFMYVVREGVGRCLEIMAPFWRKGVTEGAPVYASGARVYNSPGNKISSMSGLDWLEGCVVGVWADGRDIGSVTVVGGEIEFPYGIESDNVVVGCRMPWRLRTLRIANYGQQDGTGLGRHIRVVGAKVDLFESAGVRVGTLTEIDKMTFEDDAEENPDDPLKLRTGMFTVPVDSSWESAGVVILEGDDLYPVTVRGISVAVEGED